jgi:hypothetical protein
MRKSRYTEAQIVSILKELVEGRVSGAPTRARLRRTAKQFLAACPSAYYRAQRRP